MAVQKKTSTSTPTAATMHPPYLQMIKEAITTMKDRSGSSQPAIARYIEENYTRKHLPPNFRKMLSMQLKRFVKSEKLVKVKNSYKILSTEKAKKPANPPKEKTSPVVKKIATKVEVAKKSVEKAKKTKRLSQVKTPEVLKEMKSPIKNAEKTKKKVVKAATPAKRKAVSNTTPKKKAKK